MASISTINAWIDELASSISPALSTKPKQQQRRITEAFRRRLRHHNFARTNQFEVRDQLNGLEEKFQVLNRDDLSDALHDRRVDLRSHQERWIPDILDLLLRLSNDPLRKTKLTDLSDLTHFTEAPLELKWADIGTEIDFDRTDPIWRNPDFSELSSGEDDAEESTATTSSASVKLRSRKHVELENAQQSRVFDELHFQISNTSFESLRMDPSDVSGPFTELQLIRHVLLMAQGYPSELFEQHQEVRLKDQVRLRGISDRGLQSLVKRAVVARRELDIVKAWSTVESPANYVQTIKQLVERIALEFVTKVSGIEENLLHPTFLQTASLVMTVSQIEEFSAPLAAHARWIGKLRDQDSIAILNDLYQDVCCCYFAYDTTGLNTVLPVFIKAFEMYMKPIIIWLQCGSFDTNLEPFFIEPGTSAISKNNLWTDWFQLNLGGSKQPPIFLKGITSTMFACGKTVAFISQVIGDQKIHNGKQATGDTLSDAVHLLTADPALPFPAAFLATLNNHFSSMLASTTSTLREILETRCGLNRTLDAFEHIYLRKNGVVQDLVEGRIFSRIDKCMDNWNDRFVIADMLEDIYGDINCIDHDAIEVQSAHTSSRSMESRRRSVRILGALAIDYTLPWPVANMIPGSSLLIYRRISLHLTQIRRAKYILETTAYIHVHSTPIDENPKHQLMAQTTTFMLIQFTNTLYDHFTSGVTLPMTTKMRKDLATTNSFDAMIAVHQKYIMNLDFACLTSKQLKTLRETLIGLLDMCIRFADLVSTPPDATSKHDKDGAESDDFEAGSFRSAQSRRKNQYKWKADEGDEISSDDEDDDGEGEGYSSFIVLDEDTSIVQEVKKLQVQFQRQLDFFVAGLRGVGRAGETVEEFELLAERLDWKGTLGSRPSFV